MLPVISKKLIKTLTDVGPGDHILSSNSQHGLVQSVDTENSYLVMYMIKSKKISCERRHFSGKSEIYIIEYDSKSCLFDKRSTLSMAKNECQRQSQWRRSDLFVTTMKCGSGFIIDDCCIMPEEIHVHCTDIDENTAVDNGDHLLIREDETGRLCSVLVCRFYHQTKIEIIPRLDESSSQNCQYQIIDLTQNCQYISNY